MARNKRLYIIWEGKAGFVYTRDTDKHVATLRKNSGSKSFRIHMASNPGHPSEMIEGADACLSRIEREIF